MRNGEAGASRRNGSALAQTRRRKRGRALEPRRRSARLQAARGGGERRSCGQHTRHAGGRLGSGCAEAGRKKIVREACGRQHARVRKKFACDDGRWGVEEQCSERTRHCSHM